MKEDFDQVLLDRLKKEKLSPAPRWRFQLKDYSIWTLGAVSCAVGSLSVALIIHLAKNNDWEIYDEISEGLGQFIFLTLPYFWIVLLSLFLSSAYYNIRHTKQGYRYPVSTMLSVCVLASLAGGLILHGVGIGQLIDDYLGEQAPYYRELLNPQVRFWDSPEHGRLMGVVSSSTVDQDFILIDFRDKAWLVRCGACTRPLPVTISPGRPLRLLGQVVGDNSFTASRVLPVGSGRGMFNGRGFGPGRQMMAQPFMMPGIDR